MFFSFLCACHCAEDVPFNERLCSLKEQRDEAGSMIKMYKYVKGCCEKEGNNLFSMS